MGSFKTIFVTVGTTKFDSLIETICSPELLSSLRQLGCSNLIIQYGNGDDRLLKNAQFEGLQMTSYSLKPSIREDIQKADLVVSHAGAGSCLEILRELKPLVVVINEELMGNHQVELAEQLNHDENLFYCTPKTLRWILETSDFRNLKPYERGDMMRFVKQLDNLMGF